MTRAVGRRVVLLGGHTETAAIDGISAAGADPNAMIHTPSVDLEVVAYGRPVRAPVVPVSPTGCLTPAVITRAVRERLGFDLLVLDAGLARATAPRTVVVGEGPDGDVREAQPVPAAERTFHEARRLGETLPDDHLVVGETIPGGTTTALGLLTALDERPRVSSSLLSNPLSLKRDVVETALEASDLDSGGGAGTPIETVTQVDNPVLAAVAGVTTRALETDTSVTLAGGTQMAAAAALGRHAGVSSPVELATTSFLADDETAAIHDHATTLNLDLTVTDPRFDASDHPAMAAYAGGEAKEGVGMGGALALTESGAISMDELRAPVRKVHGHLAAGSGA